MLGTGTPLRACLCSWKRCCLKPLDGLIHEVRMGDRSHVAEVVEFDDVDPRQDRGEQASHAERGSRRALAQHVEHGEVRRLNPARAMTLCCTANTPSRSRFTATASANATGVPLMVLGIGRLPTNAIE